MQTTLLLALLIAQEKPKADKPPQPLYAIQLAAEPGKASKLTVRGLGVDKATAVRVGDPKSSAKLLGNAKKVGLGNGQRADVHGDSEVDVEVTLSAELPGGSVPLTMVGPGGEGPAMLLLVNDDTPRVAEKEPNDGFKQAAPIALPQVVVGTFKQNQDVDVFRIEGKAGETIHVEVQAGRFGSPADAMLTLYDADGRTVASGELPAGRRDQVLRVRLAKDGAYFLSAIEGFDQGGPNFVYRLLIRAQKSD